MMLCIKELFLAVAPGVALSENVSPFLHFSDMFYFQVVGGDMSASCCVVVSSFAKLL